MLLSGFELYAGSESNLLHEPELNLLNASFHGLPTTTLITAEFDPLRDEGEQLYRSMAEQGVEARYEPYLGVIHGFFQLSGVSESAKRCIESISSHIKHSN